MSSGRGGQEVPTLFEESAWVQCSQHAVCIFSFRPWGVRKSRPFLKNQHVFSMVSLQAHLQTCVNIQLQTGGVRKSRPFLNNQLNSQLARLQAVGVRKSRPFLKNQHGFSAATSMCVSPASDRGGQEVPTLFEESARQSVACRQTVGVRKSRPFKNQHAFNTVSLQVPLQPQTVRVMKSDPCLKDRFRQSACRSSNTCSAQSVCKCASTAS